RRRREHLAHAWPVERGASRCRRAAAGRARYGSRRARRRARCVPARLDGGAGVPARPSAPRPDGKPSAAFRRAHRCGAAKGQRVSKRDSDDSASDMEVGMTTAERRRRRRRGGGLRVPSDNVPRRSSTPPVVAPVPEDPALAMSIAYSFSGESSDPMRTTLESQVPTFENHEGMPTVIDPVSEQVEQAEQVEQGDFEMKTREMTAVDLEALGLSDAGTSGNNLPIQRLSSPTADSLAG